MPDFKLGNLFWEITAKTGDILKKITTAQKKVSDFGKKLTNIGKSLSLRVTLPILGIGAAALKSAADFEKQTVAFETLLGSAEKAQDLLKAIEDFSATTPFQLPGLLEGSKRLLAFGVAQKDIIQTMTNLGNAATGNQEVLDRLTLAYGKLKAKGRATLEELNMFTEAGVPILQALADQYGVTTQEIFKMINTGRIGFEDVDQALKNLTTGTGKFAGLIEKQAGTFSGALSTFKDNLSLAGRALVEGLLPPLTDMLQKATEWVKKFAEMSDSTKRIILVIAGVTAAIGPLAIAIGGLITFFSGPAGIIFAITAAAAALGIFISESKRARDERLEEQFGDIAKQAGIAADEVKRVADGMEFVEKSSFIDVTRQVEILSRTLGISRETVVDIALATADITDETRAELQAIKDVLSAQRESLEANTGLLEKELLRVAATEDLAQAREEAAEAAKAEAVAEAEINRQIEARRKLIEEEYLAARDLVLATLESEKTEYEKIQEQMDELAAHPWAGGRLETDRLAAIEILNQRLTEIREEEIAGELEKEEAREAIRQEFEELRLSDQERRILEIEEQGEKYIEAGIERIEAETWVQETIDAIREAELQRELERIQKELKARVEMAGKILGLAQNLDSALDMFAQNELTRLENAGASEEELDEKKKELAKESFARKKLLSATETVINTAAAIVGFLADPGGLAGVALSIGAGIIGAVQLAAILSTPLPALAEGGIMVPTPGGRVVQVAEGGSAEAVIPLNDEGADFIRDALGGAVGEITDTEDMQPIILPITIEGVTDAIYAKINVGIKDGQIVVDARQLTNLDEAVRVL